MAINIGLLGASGIAPGAVITPARRRRDVLVAAVAARSADRAREYAAAYRIPRWYESYDALLADPEIDLVYVGLPPSEHAAWTIAALRAGKDVLCEKPFAMNQDEARAVLAVAAETGRRVIEAFHDQYHPLWTRISELCSELGPLVGIEADLLVSNPYEPGAIRHEPSLGGGALMDLGCYAAHWLRSVAEVEPSSVGSVEATFNPSGADMSVTAEMSFPTGATGVLRASMEHDGYVGEIRVVAERGSFTVVNPLFPAAGHSIRIRRGDIDFVETVAGGETYDHQLEQVVEGIATGRPLRTEGNDILANIALIDAVRGGFSR